MGGPALKSSNTRGKHPQRRAPEAGAFSSGETETSSMNGGAYSINPWGGAPESGCPSQTEITNFLTQGSRQQHRPGERRGKFSNPTPFASSCLRLLYTKIFNIPTFVLRSTNIGISPCSGSCGWRFSFARAHSVRGQNFRVKPENCHETGAAPLPPRPAACRPAAR